MNNIIDAHRLFRPSQRRNIFLPIYRRSISATAGGTTQTQQRISLHHAFSLSPNSTEDTPEKHRSGKLSASDNANADRISYSIGEGYNYLLAHWRLIPASNVPLVDLRLACFCYCAAFR